MSTGPQQLAGKCTTCDSYVRKIEHVERTLSGRDAVITVLHSRVQTFENDYKNLLSQFETLRFEHSAALQDNFSLSEINAKLEEICRCSNADNSLVKHPEHLCKESSTENTNYICCQEIELHSTDSTTDFLDIKLKQLASDIYNLVMSQDRHSPDPEMVNLLHKTQQFQQCCCQLIDQLNDAQENNEALSETLNVVTTENKNNLEIINELKKELRRSTEGYEKEMEGLKGKVTKLEDNLEETNLEKRKLEQSIDGMQEGMKGLRDRLKLLINENDKLQACACEVQSNEKRLRRELYESSLKLSECAEENTNLCQRIEMLDKYNADLVGEVRNLQNQLQQQTNKQECKKHVEDEDCTNLKCRKTQIDALEKLDEVEVLKNEMQKHLDEKQQLQKELERVKTENHKEIERLQGLVEHFQKQVEMLLAEHDEKTCQIKSVASELETIRKNVTDDKDSYLEQIKKLESERDEAKRQMLELACECDRGQCELDKMKQELGKKQCIIQELEKSVDQFNDTLKNFDQTVEEITNENARLKTEKDNLAKELKLKEAHDDLLTENAILKRTVKQLQLDTCQLQSDIETLSRESGASAKLRQAYDELKKMFDATSKESEELKEKCRECSRLRKEMEQENVKLQEENRKLKQTAEAIKGECGRLQRHCALKCLEMESLNVSAEQQKQEQVTKMRCQIEEKCAELKKMRKQLDSSTKQSQITRDEYNNLRKEYKEIKLMMSEQVKTYKLTQMSNGSNQTPVADHLKQKLAEKDQEIATLHCKLRDASFEMIELKDQISKVVDDNNVLKNSINGLISNLERKIRGPSFTSLPSNSTELIAGEILNSLANIEEIITKNGECPNRCCNCMSEIQSQYSFQVSDNTIEAEKLCIQSPCPCKQSSPSRQVSNYHESNKSNFSSSLEPTNKASGSITADSDDLKLSSITSESDLHSK